MALIQCPECRKEISDKSKVCIYCGFPVSNIQNSKCYINGKEYDLSFIFEEENVAKCIGIFRKMINCSLIEAKDTIEKIKQTQIIPRTIVIKEQHDSNIPKCPTCGSTDIKKISATTKVTNTVAFGIFGTKRHKTYHCNNCKYEW